MKYFRDNGVIYFQDRLRRGGWILGGPTHILINSKMSLIFSDIILYCHFLYRKHVIVKTRCRSMDDVKKMKLWFFMFQKSDNSLVWRHDIFNFFVCELNWELPCELLAPSKWVSWDRTINFFGMSASMWKEGWHCYHKEVPGSIWSGWLRFSQLVPGIFPALGH